MTKLKRLPGTDCRYYSFGRCIYEEILNPGYNRGWRCEVLSGLIHSYDHFLDQAEIFNLNGTKAEAIWKERLSARIPVWNCPDYRPDPEREGECILLFHNQCILSMPSCPGRCRLFSPVQPKGKMRS